MRYMTLVFMFFLANACAETLDNGLVQDSEMNEDEFQFDLREANVVDVTYDTGTGQFGVTLLHDDDGEEGYADWWQVETLDGELLGRRVLTHRHDNKPFTRYATISGLQDIVYVVVRGHDQDHGYGGQVIVLNLVTGSLDRIEQGSDEVDFSDYLPEN